MKTMISQSERRYKIAFIESEDISVETLSLNELITLQEQEGADYEWKYAISQIIDKVLDLKLYENLPFNSNRDNSKSLAIILRWK